MKPPHRHGLSLIEVVASIALLATLMITLLTAWTRHKNQLQLAQHKLRAVELLDQKLGQWYVQTGDPPFPASGRLGNTQYEWKSFRTPNKRPLPGGLSVRLGAHQYTVAINDLDSAVNLNTLSRNAGMTGVRRATQKAITKLPGTRFTIRLPRTRSGGNPIVMDSWGQVFASTQQTSTQMVTAIPVLQQFVTCWGSGKLNINRASDESIRLLGSSLGRSGLFGRIIEERNATESVNLKQMIESAASSAKDTQLLQATLGNRSTSWSVLITSDSGTPALLTILESGSGNFANRRSSFSF